MCVTPSSSLRFSKGDDFMLNNTLTVCKISEFILRNSLNFILRYVVVQKSDEVRINELAERA